MKHSGSIAALFVILSLRANMPLMAEEAQCRDTRDGTSLTRVSLGPRGVGKRCPFNISGKVVYCMPQQHVANKIKMIGVSEYGYVGYQYAGGWGCSQRECLFNDEHSQEFNGGLIIQKIGNTWPMSLIKHDVGSGDFLYIFVTNSSNENEQKAWCFVPKLVSTERQYWQAICQRVLRRV